MALGENMLIPKAIRFLSVQGRKSAPHTRLLSEIKITDDEIGLYYWLGG
jgi:hypothetical protein